MDLSPDVVKVPSWDGTISSSEFRVACLALAAKWKNTCSDLPSWSWLPCPKHPWNVPRHDEGYLSLENVCLLSPTGDNASEGDPLGKGMPSSLEDEEPVDDATLELSSDRDTHHYDFHIIYSASYRVPVLYFRAYHSDGQLVTIDEIEKHLPAYSLKVLVESRWTFITQEEHPYLNRPWYKLHPCGTSEWIKLLLCSNVSQARNEVPIEQYLASWLSVVGQVIGLRIPYEVFKDRNQM